MIYRIYAKIKSQKILLTTVDNFENAEYAFHLYDNLIDKGILEHKGTPVEKIEMEEIFENIKFLVHFRINPKDVFKKLNLKDIIEKNLELDSTLWDIIQDYENKKLFITVNNYVKEHNPKELIKYIIFDELDVIYNEEKSKEYTKNPDGCTLCYTIPCFFETEKFIKENDK